MDRQHSAGTPARPRPTTAATRASTASCPPPTCWTGPGVAHIGTFRLGAERRRPVILTTEDGVRVGVVAGTYGLNGFLLPEGREWSVSMWDADNLLAQAHAARAAGADIVVVHVHWGDEYVHEPNAEQIALAEQLTRSPDVDLVLGEHAHVVQPITKVNGKWVVYGMGNMVAQQDPARADTYQGILVAVHVHRAAQRPVRGHPRGVRPDRVEPLAPRLGADPRRAACAGRPPT